MPYDDALRLHFRIPVPQVVQASLVRVVTIDEQQVDGFIGEPSPRLRAAFAYRDNARCRRRLGIMVKQLAKLSTFVSEKARLFRTWVHLDVGVLQVDTEDLPGQTMPSQTVREDARGQPTKAADFHDDRMF